MRESTIEDYLIKMVKQAKGSTRKLKYIGRKDAPDRLVLLPNYHCFVELKAPGLKPRFSQVMEHRRLWKAGCEVLIIDSFEGVDSLIARATR